MLFSHVTVTSFGVICQFIFLSSTVSVSDHTVFILSVSMAFPLYSPAFIPLLLLTSYPSPATNDVCSSPLYVYVSLDISGAVISFGATASFVIAVIVLFAYPVLLNVTSTYMYFPTNPLPISYSLPVAPVISVTPVLLLVVFQYHL